MNPEFQTIKCLSSLDRIHPHWQPLLTGLIQAAQNYFGEDLRAVYLLGSVGRGQEEEGYSDVDLELVITRSPDELERGWAESLSKQTLIEWPTLLKIDLDLLFIDTLLRPDQQRLRFIFATDAVLLWGNPLRLPTETWSPGPKLAWLLNSHYHWARQEIFRCLQQPNPEEIANPRHVAECIHWIAKQALRLGLGLAMCEQPIYTNRVADMPALAGQVLPELKTTMELSLQQYRQPVNDTTQALSFMAQLAPLYQLAEQIWGEPVDSNHD